MRKKKRKKGNNLENLLLYFLIVIFAVFLYSAFSNVVDYGFRGIPITGLVEGQAEVFTPSQVEIKRFVSLSMSDTLLSGIDFGIIQELPVYNTNASANYNSTFETEYAILVGNDTNTNVNFCIRATRFNNSADQEIGLDNYTWDDDLANSANLPTLLNATSMNLNYVNGSENVGPEQENYYRFWLNISGGQPPGIYNNTVYFRSVPYTFNCAG